MHVSGTIVTSLFLSIFCCILCCKGYKLVITRALWLHGVYCTQPSGFSAIYTRAHVTTITNIISKLMIGAMIFLGNRT